MTRQFEISETLADGTVQDESSAVAGATYYVSNPAVGTITADGLFTSAAPGGTYVTMIFAGRVAVVPLLVTTPTVVTTAAPTVTVGSGGGVISTCATKDSLAVWAGPCGCQVCRKNLACRWMAFSAKQGS